MFSFSIRHWFSKLMTGKLGRTWPNRVRGRQRVWLDVERMEDRTCPTFVIMVKDIVAGAGTSNARNFVDVNGTLFFTAKTSGEGRELWKSDGTADGTVLVSDIRPGPLGSNPKRLKSALGTLFFVADDGTHGDELWRVGCTNWEMATLIDRQLRERQPTS